MPLIVVTNRELRDLTEDALEAVRRANEPPTLFQRGGALTRLRHSEHDVPFLEVLSESAVRGLMARTADWRRSTKRGLVPVAPPIPVVKDVLALPEWHGIPILNGIVGGWEFHGNGRVQARTVNIIGPNTQQNPTNRNVRLVGMTVDELTKE